MAKTKWGQWRQIWIYEYQTFLLLPYLSSHFWGSLQTSLQFWTCNYCSCERDCRGKGRKQTLCRNLKEDRWTLGEDGKKGLILLICLKIIWLCNRRKEEETARSTQSFHSRKLLLLIADNTHNIHLFPHSSLVQSLSYPAGGEAQLYIQQTVVLTC